jgi:hypothetical protein
MMIQTLARVSDPDITGVVQVGSVEATPVIPWIVIDHEPLALGDVAIVKVDGVLVTLGEAGSSADYEYRRVSATQTVIKKSTAGTNLVEVVPGAIGTFTIGKNFKVGVSK